MKKSTLAVIGTCFLAGFLYLVFRGTIILPQSFHLGLLAIHYYGLIMAVAVACGFYLALRRAPRFGVDSQQAEDILFWAIIGGFIGARLYHVLSSIGYYYQHPIDVFKVWNGGLSIYGAVIGGALSLFFAAKIFHLKSEILNLFDWLAPSVLLGQIIGRFGNLFNYEAFGYPTKLPWKMFVPENFRPEVYQTFSFFHPWFLYEALGNVCILFFLLKLLKPKAPGEVVIFYILLYNALRFGLEFLRIDSTFIGVFRLNALVSLFLCLAALGSLFHFKRHV